MARSIEQPEGGVCPRKTATKRARQSRFNIGTQNSLGEGFYHLQGLVEPRNTLEINEMKKFAPLTKIGNVEFYYKLGVNVPDFGRGRMQQPRPLAPCLRSDLTAEAHTKWLTPRFQRVC